MTEPRGPMAPRIPITRDRVSGTRALPDFSTDRLRRMSDLAESFSDAPTEDVLRVFAAAGHELTHRSARLTAEALGRALRDEVDRIHREGLP